MLSISGKFASPRSLLLLGLLAVVLALKLVFQPGMAWLDAQEKEIEKVRNQVGRKLWLGERKEVIAKLWTDLQANEQEYSALFFPKEHSPEQMQLDLQKELETLAGQSGVEISNLDWLPPSKQDVLVCAPLQIRGSGELKQIISLLAGIEKAARHYAVENLTIRPQAKKKTLQIELDVVAYGFGE